MSWEARHVTIVKVKTHIKNTTTFNIILEYLMFMCVCVYEHVGGGE